MAKSPPRRPRESVPVPTKRELSDAAKEMRRGHPSGGRVMRQGQTPKKGR